MIRPLYPLDLLRSINILDRKIYGFSIIARNVPGVLASIGKACADALINIIDVVISTEQIVGGNAHLFLVADLTDSTFSPEDLKNELSKISSIISISIVEPFVNFIIDDTHFPLTIYNGKSRAIVIGEAVMKGFLYGINVQLGEEVSYIALWHMGYSSGKEIWDLYYEWRKTIVRDLVELMLKTAIALGWWSHYEVVEYSPMNKYAKIRVWDNWECRLKGVSGRAESHFIRGMLAGFLTKHFNTECQAFETKCISKGDEYCEFEIEPKSLTT
ncbi:MAG: V4R domain-containing protein [Thermoprotei archaeon]